MRAEGQGDGSHKNSRRRRAQRRDPDFGGEERGAAADDRVHADGPDADPGKSAAPRRRRPARLHPRQSWRRLFGRRQADRRGGRHRPDRALARPHDRRHDGPVRAGGEDARELLGDRAAHRAHGRGARLAAGRLRDRHPAGRLVVDGVGEARRADRYRRRLCRRQGAEGPDRRGDRVSQVDGRGNARGDDGGVDRAWADADPQCGARAGGRRSRPMPQQDGRAHPRRRHADHRN